MQFEKFDNKVRQAADQHHPNYDEKAWAKMEKLLDRDLPQQKNDRRKLLFLLLFLLLAGGGAWLLIGKPWQSSSIEQTASKTLPATSVDKSNAGQSKTTTGASPADKTAIEKSAVEPVNPDTEPTGPVDNTVKTVTTKQESSPLAITGKKLNATADSKNGKRVKKDISAQDQLAIASIDAAKAKKPGNNSIDNAAATIAVSPLKKDDGIKKDLAKDDLTVSDKSNNNNTVSTSNNKNPGIDAKKNVVTEQPKPAEGKNIAQAGKRKKKNELFFSFSAGPDVSYVGLDNPGKVKLLGGAGIGYSIGKRLTIRTGFYTTHKVYTASKYDYKPSVQIPGYPYLDKIDANCNVYEIPLNLVYNFGKSEKQNFFASAGLSSFIMKKEVYDYQFTYPNNPVTYTYTKTVNNENRHYFSVLGLSAGYQRRINKVFSLSAEPYVKLPLGGIGYGKVKLNSAGILFSANIRPFH